jgi:O-antigen/teichoic acid export membrane protein
MSEIKTVFQIVKEDLVSKTGVQTLTLFSSQILALALGMLIGIINTRTFGPIGYGVLAFFTTFTGFTVIFFRFGLASSICLMLVKTKEIEKEKELIGAAVVIAFFVGITYSLFTFISSFFVDDIFHTNVGWILRYVSVLVVALPFTLFIPQIGSGINNINLLSIFNIIPNMIYLLGALILLNLIQIEPFYFILLNLLSTLFSLLILIYGLHPKLTNLYENMREILKHTKEYGFNLYLGQIADQSTYKLNGIFISLFVNTTQLGFFSLAMATTSPMIGLSYALSTSLFKDSVYLNRIPKKAILYNLIWLVLCVSGLIIFGSYIIAILFGEEFLPASRLIVPLVLAGFFQGMYQPYLSFLTPKTSSKILRNFSFFGAFVNLSLNIFLIPSYGAYGAALASMISMLSWYILLFRQYKKYCSNG